jgi:sulfur-oxidizing protein SoxX
MMMKTALSLGALFVFATGATSVSAQSRQETMQVIKSSFHDKGIAKLDRLNQSELQQICSEAAMNGKELPKKVRERLEKQQMATVKYPADGKFLGDWKAGERIAQTGVGLQWTDTEKTVNGGNCYACHELTEQEIPFGNIGPSLKGYGKLRGYNDSIVKYTWGKIWNTHAYNACSQMPRFGDAGILTEAQLKDVMALLLDPASPVNK